MRIAITSDIHANLPALERFLERERFDFWIDLGDCIGYYPFPSEVLEILREKCDKNVIGDHGDCCLREDYRRLNPYAKSALRKTRKMLSKEDLDYLRSLRKKMRFEIKGKSFFITHGSPRNPMWEYVFPNSERKIDEILKMVDTDFLLLGHAHTSFLRKRHGTILINPGSLGQPRDGKPAPSYCILEKGEAKFNRFSYDIDRTAKKVKEEDFPEILAERLYKGV